MEGGEEGREEGQGEEGEGEEVVVLVLITIIATVVGVTNDSGSSHRHSHHLHRHILIRIHWTSKDFERFPTSSFRNGAGTTPERQRDDIRNDIWTDTGRREG